MKSVPMYSTDTTELKKKILPQAAQLKLVLTVRNDTNKYCVSVSTTNFIFCAVVYMSGRHVSTYSVILRPSKKTDPKTVQFIRTVGSQMLTSVNYRSKTVQVV